MKKLYKSRTDRKIDSICGGIGEYLNVDPTLIRLVWVVLGCCGAGIVAYLIAAFIVPENPDHDVIADVN